MTAALSDRCARTGGPYGTGPCLARSDGCAFCALSATRIPPPTREEPPRDRRS